MRSRLLLFASGATLLGCGSADTSVPRDWRPLRLGTTAGGVSGCPPVAGSYGVKSELLFTTMIGQHLPANARTIAWRAFTLQGDADTALTAIVTRARAGADTLRLRRGEAYQCTDEWLAPTFPRDGLASDGTDSESKTLRGAERAVFVASARDGALVARLRTTTYRDVSIWCGDGCRTMRVPWSGRSVVRWERQAPLRVSEAERIPDDPPLAVEPRAVRAARLIRAALPDSVRLRGVSPRADGWHVSIDLRDKAMLVPLLSTLNATPGIADARVERTYESLNLEGSWHEVLWLRFTNR